MYWHYRAITMIWADMVTEYKTHSSFSFMVIFWVWLSRAFTTKSPTRSCFRALSSALSTITGKPLRILPSKLFSWRSLTVLVHKNAGAEKIHGAFFKAFMIANLNDRDDYAKHAANLLFWKKSGGLWWNEHVDAENFAGAQNEPLIQGSLWRQAPWAWML